MNILNVLIAYAVMLAGYVLSAAFYFMTTNKWNGYKIINKQIVVLFVMLIIALLLNSYPELSEVIKLASGLDVNVENSKVGYLSLGGMAVLVRTKFNTK